MAENDVDEESTFWPWVIGIALLALVIWVAAELSGGDPASDERAVIETVTPARRPDSAPPAGVDSIIAVEAFRAWLRDSAYVAYGEGAAAREGLARLAAALTGVAHSVGDTALQLRSAGLREAVSDTATAAGDDALRAAMHEAVDILAQLQASADRLAAARAAADELEPGVPLQDQSAGVRRYLRLMADALPGTLP